MKKRASSDRSTPSTATRPNGQKASPLLNWAGNYQYSATQLHQPASLEEVQKLVKQYPKLKVLGTRHCFNSIADSTEQLIQLGRLIGVVALDKQARTVTVEAGISYGQLCPYLHENGFALHNLASLPHISIAGACATATHGSGDQNKNLASAVLAMEIVTADGESLALSRERDGELFKAAVVNLGGLGVVTKLTLGIEPTFQMRQDVFEGLSFTQFTAHYDEIMSSGYSVSLFTDWQSGQFSEVWIKQRLLDGIASFNIEPTFFGARLATQNRHPIANISAENCTEQMGIAGPWYERLPHFRMGYTPSSGKELQSEYFIPRHHAPEALLILQKLGGELAPHLLISEVRTIAADDFWMSPCYQQSCVAFHFTWQQHWSAVSQLLLKMEELLAPFDARPHWGKLFTMAPARLQSRYTKLPDFQRVLKQYDPQGKFRNAFVDTYVMD